MACSITKINVKQEGAIHIKHITNFSDAGLHPAMLRNVELAGYDRPTPIQQYTIPAVMEGHDLVACAQTGKCLGYLQTCDILLTFQRVRKDGCLLDPNLVQAHGQGEEALCSSP